ncbi:MAG TPA: hypothetical protein DD435_14335 [Cyanobacteria bacterium UBA8530]|nr:hypothetical protein [Cyanobacteria bacterium UBA8530]
MNLARGKAKIETPSVATAERISRSSASSVGAVANLWRCSRSSLLFFSKIDEISSQKGLKTLN